MVFNVHLFLLYPLDMEKAGFCFYHAYMDLILIKEFGPLYKDIVLLEF